MWCKLRLCKFISSLAVVLLILTQPRQHLQASGDVHFGTIFVEDLQYDNSDDNDYINHLSDNSEMQKDLEQLYRSIGRENAELKKLNLSRNPASAKKKNKVKEGSIGVLANDDLPQQIIYFLELRIFEGNQPAKIFAAPDQNAKVMHSLEPGEIVKIVNTPHEYLHKERMDRENNGLWLKLAQREGDPENMYIYYDWRNWNTLTPHELPIEASILVPRDKNSVPVFSRPGPWTWRDCGLEEQLCVDNVGTHIVAYLFDATVVEMSRFRGTEETHRLFYKMGYHLKDKEGKVRHKIGWISSDFVSRKITQLPKTLIATRSTASGNIGYESDEERRERLKKYYVFSSNMESETRAYNRWTNRAPGQSTEVFFQNLAIDFIAGASLFHLEQDFLDEEFDQSGAVLGFGIFAPLFLDLEIQGTFLFTVPVDAPKDETFKPAFLFKGEQWLMYTSPIAVGELPFKFGIGGYYTTMFADQLNFGYNSLVGFQLRFALEGRQTWFGFRYGPTGRDLGFRFENREIGADFGYRLNAEKGYDSWTLYGDFSDTTFINPSTDNRTSFSVFSFGIKKSL